MYNIKTANTLNDVDQNMRTVSFVLKTSLKQIISEIVTKITPLSIEVVERTENIKNMYLNGPKSTYEMLTNVLESEPKIPNLAKDAIKVISPEFNVDEIVDNIFDKSPGETSLQLKKAKAQNKLINLSDHMNTAIDNMDCFIISILSTIGNGASTLKSLRSGRVIMGSEHPRAGALRDAIGLIMKSNELLGNKRSFKIVNSNRPKESGKINDDEKAARNLTNDETTSNGVTKKQRPITLGVIVVYPDKRIQYQQMATKSDSDKYIENETNIYRDKPAPHPLFLKVSSRKSVDAIIKDVKEMKNIDEMDIQEIKKEIINKLTSKTKL